MTTVVGNRQCSMLVRTKTKTQLFDSLYKIRHGMMISQSSGVIHVIYVVKEHPLGWVVRKPVNVNPGLTVN